MKQCLRCSSLFSGDGWICTTCGFQPATVNNVPIFAPELAQGGAGFDPAAYELLAKAEASHFWFQARNLLIQWGLRQHFPHVMRYLEIGCGTGFVLKGVAEAYPEANLTGSEIFSAGLSYAAKLLPEVELLQMDARYIPYHEEFDVVGAFDVLEHIQDDESVLAGMRSALRPNGGIAITVPQHPWLWSRQDEYAHHVRRYKYGELRQKVINAGFSILLETSFVSLLLPAMMASRLTNRGKIVHGEGEMEELNIPYLMNEIFKTAMSVERWLIRIGMRLPFGGSVLLIAKRTDVLI